jgi:hypothetical protein
LRDADVDRNVVLEWILKKYNMRLWIEVICAEHFKLLS